ncbi:hypothetical protein L873DRAFT_1815137 [Choiromyces venosus 120613-1]|uniref:CBM1 domain-containing protein n=1 Tax=Choiromyces venosus 120613-1 TaxID=1336337 RepID=A0A3N4J9M7_9PEZI|nr:hypothetical protein L873DRAFT_1815137 [Choiromyces venosus 120613-1]
MRRDQLLGRYDCSSGYSCAKVNDYYFQCQPGVAATTTAAAGGGATTTASSSAPTGTGQLIRRVTSPVYHLYLQTSGSPSRQHKSRNIC